MHRKSPFRYTGTKKYSISFEPNFSIYSFPPFFRIKTFSVIICTIICFYYDSIQKKSILFLIATEARNCLSVDSYPINHNRTTCNECHAKDKHQGLETICSHDQTSNHRTYKHTNGICHVVQSVHYFFFKKKVRICKKKNLILCITLCICCTTLFFFYSSN